MTSAKETLKKLAEALGVVANEEEKVEEVVAEEATVEEPKAEEVVEETAETEEPKAEEVAEEVTEEAEVKEEPVEEPAEDSRMKEMENQLSELKELLAKALAEDNKEEAVPEIPKEEPKGINHSPEKEVRTQGKGIGNKGNSIQSRVWKYISDNK